MTSKGRPSASNPRGGGGRTPSAAQTSAKPSTDLPASGTGPSRQSSALDSQALLQADRWIITGWLSQRSALSLGGNHPDATQDHPVALDGLGRPTLRGHTLAGALFHTLRRCGVEPPQAMTRQGSVADDVNVRPSVLQAWHSHPDPIWHEQKRPARALHGLQIRPGVGIRQDTGASAEDLLWDLQGLPMGTRWPLLLELDLATWRAAAGQQAEFFPQVVLLALAEWERQRCWLGRGVARGLGWMELEKLSLHALKGESAFTWANECLFEPARPAPPSSDLPARRAFKQVRDALAKLDGIHLHQSALEVGKAFDPVQPSLPVWHQVRIRHRISVGEPRAGGWGLDTLSVGGHELGPGAGVAAALLAQKGGHAVVHPLAMQQRINPIDGRLTQAEPFVPGSAIRGPLRHALSQAWRQASPNEAILDPVTRLNWAAAGGVVPSPAPDAEAPSPARPDRAERLFGSARQDRGFHSSRLLVMDAPLARKPWKQLVLTSHAEDEFVSGTFGAALFGRLVLVQASFDVEMVIEHLSAEAAQADAKMLVQLLGRQQGHGLRIGGGQWRGHGGVRWTPAPCEQAPCGTDWQPWPVPLAEA